MREIKFRGLNKPTMQWKYGYMVVDEKYTQIWQEGDVPCPVEYETVGQFTGLQDTNNVDIYEGDVCLLPNGEKRVVTYDAPSFWLAKNLIDKVDVDAFSTPSIYEEVIGNIYENPELLGGE